VSLYCMTTIYLIRTMLSFSKLSAAQRGGCPAIFLQPVELILILLPFGEAHSPDCEWIACADNCHIQYSALLPLAASLSICFLAVRDVSIFSLLTLPPHNCSYG
jgi:hypothetical protein